MATRGFALYQNVTDRKQWQDAEERWSNWLAQAQAGDAQAYATLLHELKDALRGYLISHFGYSHMLDDCVQESLLAIHEARHTYDPRRPIRPWLFAIVRHRTIDLLRRNRPESNDVLADGAVESNPDQVIAEFASTHDSEKLLARLSSNLRDALLLTKFMGLSTRECADRLGVSESVVKVRVFRGIRQLRTMWEAEML